MKFSYASSFLFVSKLRRGINYLFVYLLASVANVIRRERGGGGGGVGGGEERKNPELTVPSPPRLFTYLFIYLFIYLFVYLPQRRHSSYNYPQIEDCKSGKKVTTFEGCSDWEKKQYKPHDQLKIVCRQIVQ